MSAAERGNDAGTRPAFAVLAATVLAAAFLVGTVAAPLLAKTHPVASGFARLAYAPLCHQLPERSFTVGAAAGRQAVCARCAGIYAGGVAGLAFAAWWVAVRGGRPRPRLLVAAAVPTAIDVLAGWIGGAGSGLGNAPRAVVALPLGFLAALFLAAAIADLASSRSLSIRARGPVEAIDG